MILSVSTTFAADEVTIDDEITLSDVGDEVTIDEEVTLSDVGDEVTIDDEILSAEDDVGTINEEEDDVLQANNNLESLEQSHTVTNDTFFNYFDKDTGTLISDADELIFEGDFSGLNASAILIAGGNPVKLRGNGVTLTNVQFLVMQGDVTIDGFNLIYNDGDGRLINVVGETVLNNITISNNKIDFSAVKDYDSYAIFAGADLALGSNSITNLNILNNIFRYVGNTNGSTINNVIRVVGFEGDDEDYPLASSNIFVKNNKFDVDIPSVARGYDNYRYETILYSAGMEFYHCSDLELNNNTIDLKYTTTDGGIHDTIDIIDVRVRKYNDDGDQMSCENITISNNTINAVGYNYIYAMSVSANNIQILENNINVTAEGYMVGGIYVEAPSTLATVKDNNVTIKAPSVTYGIYSLENSWGGQVDSITIQNNKVYGDAYTSCGMELGGSNFNVEANDITSIGNNTYGIVLSSARTVSTISKNKINCLGNNIGNVATGDPYLLSNSSKALSVSGNVRITNNNIESTDIGINAIIEGEIEIDNNNIVVNANNGNVENYAIKATELNKLTLTNNNITFVGKTEGNAKSNAVYIFDIDNAVIKKNNFDLSLVSANIPWIKVGDDWVPLAVSEGIVVDSSNGVVFEDNAVISTYNSVVDTTLDWYGPTDTIYVIDFVDCDNAAIRGNVIDVTGSYYIYAITISGSNLNISGNDIKAKADVHYAEGIEVKGNGVIENNNISAVAPNIAYGIISGMTSVSLSNDVINNNISANAYYACGISYTGEKLNAESNDIAVSGNYTVGINSDANTLNANKNNIKSIASNTGNMELQGIKTETAGIAINKGNFSISNNDIETTGDYTINAGEANGNITNNELLSNNGEGSNSIIGVGTVNSTGNPSTHNKYLKVILFANDLTKVYGSNNQFIVKVLDENGQAVINKTITFVFSNGKTISVSTDSEGFAKADIDFVKGEYSVTSKFNGDSIYGSKSITNSIVVNPKPTVITAPAASVLLTAVKKGYIYKITLKDNSGKVLANQKVTINGKGFTTDKNGVVNYKLAASKVGTQKLTVKFAGDDKYAASTATATIKINKEASKLTAKKATFKAKKKSKKYSVTLKDSKGKAISKVKVTIKVGKKTFKANTNKKGKATFNLKKLTKKGKYTAKITFAGNGYYNKVTKSVKITVKK